MAKGITKLDLDNSEYLDVQALIDKTNTSVYMTGRAGTGKSTFLKHIVKHTKKKNIVLAPTGIAAVNVGGVTIHSFFKVPLHPFAPDDANYSSHSRLKERLKYNKEKIKIIQEIELIVIDEVSMVRADLLDFIDLILRAYTDKHNIPFGGKQLLLVGDAFQLEPVVRNEDWDILRHFYTSPYFFNARVFTQIELVQIELQKVYRQKESQFLSILDRVRLSTITPADIDLINKQVSTTFVPPTDQLYITLTTTKANADYINDSKLSEINQPAKNYQGNVTGEFPESAYPTNLTLTLKVGAQIVFVKNDMERRWYNGTLAKVTDMQEEGIWAEDENGNSYFVIDEVWNNVRYKYDEKKHKVTEEIIGTFKQLPIKLAWGITIHKSQGLTFDHVIIDIGRGAFAYGQTYVALSRSRTLEGIVLRSPITQRDIMTNSTVVAFAAEANNRQLIDKQIADAKAQQLYRAATNSFKQKQYTQAVAQFFDALTIRPADLSNMAVRRLVATKLSIINHLENEIEQLIEKKQESKKAIAEFAREYFTLAKQSWHKYHDSRATIANLNKALRLQPDYISALIMRTEINLELGDYTQALADANYAVEHDKHNTATLRNRAMVHIKMRNYGNAYNDLTAAIRLNDQESQTYHTLATVCDHLGEPDEAQRYRNIGNALEGKYDTDDDE